MLVGLPEGHQLIEGEVVFSGHGDRLLYAARYKGFTYVVDGGKVAGKFLEAKALAVSPDSRHVAFSAEKEPGKYFRILDGDEVGPFSMVCDPTFSRNSEHLAFQAQVDDRWRNAAGKVGSKVINYSAPADMVLMPPVFSPDNLRIVTFPMYYKKVKTACVISSLDMREESRREADSISSIALSADGRVMAYAADENGKARAVKININDSKESLSPLYDRILGVALSADGTHLMFGAEKNGKRVLVVDDRETPAPAFFTSVIMSPDGKSAAYVAQEPDSKYLVVDGTPREAYDDVYYPVYAAEGNTVAYAGCKAGKCRVCIGERFGAEWYDYVSGLQFSKDGRHLAAIVSLAGKKMVLLFNRDAAVVKKGPLVDNIWPAAFENNVFGYLALVGREFWWKELGLK